MLSIETYNTAYYLGVALVPTAVIAAALIFALSKKTGRRSDTHPWPKVPGSLPLIGNLLSLGDPENFAVKVEDWAEQYGRETGVFEFSLMGKQYVVPCRADMLMEVARQRPFRIRRNRNLVSAAESVGADGLFTAEGDAWKRSRRVVAPPFDRRNMESYLDAIKLISRRLVDKWKMQSAGTPLSPTIVINRDLVGYSMDIIMLTSCGYDLNSLGKGKSQMASDVKTLFHLSFIRALSPVQYWKIPFIGPHLDGGSGPTRRILTFFNEVIEAHNSRVESDDGQMKTFLAKAIDIGKREDAGIPNDRLVGNLVTLLFGGTDTSSTTMTSCLWEIAKDTSLQEELAEEARKVSLDCMSVNNLLQGIPRLRSLVYEVLRIHGPTPFLMFEAAKDVTLSGTTLPAQTLLIFLQRFVSKTSDDIPTGPCGEKSSEFCARRWLSIDCSAARKGLSSVSVNVMPSDASWFLPFGHGLRRCPGAEFAEVEILIGLTHVLTTFQVSVKNDHPPVKLVSRLTETFNGDIELVFAPRK